MKRSLVFAGLAFALVVTAISGVRVTAAPNDRAQINTLYQRFSTAFQHKDLNGIMSVYVRGNSLFVFDVTPPRQHVGWNDYRNDWKDTFAGFKGQPAFSVNDLDVTISGDLAYTHSIQHVAGKLAKGGSITANVRVTDVLRKINGKWLIVQEHVSIPVDFTTMKPDIMSRP